MNALIDTNVVLDVLTRRELYFEDSQLVLLASEQGHIRGFVSASAVTDIFYITHKCVKRKDIARALLKKLLVHTVSVAAVDGHTVMAALNAEWNDFEDCLQYEVGKAIRADFIVTRNRKDFSGAAIPAIEPKDFLDIIAPMA